MNSAALSIPSGTRFRRELAVVGISRRSARNGASLVLVLVITAAMTVVILVFAKIVKSEMRLSRGYSNVLRADLAARAGTAEAESILLNLFHDHPDSVTFWDPQMGASTTPGTVFLYRDLPPDKEYPTTTTTVPKVYARPLVSGATEQLFYSAGVASQYPQTLTADKVASANSIDINTILTSAKTSPFNGDPNGWVGLPANDSEGRPVRDGNGKTTPQAIQVPWIDVLKDPSQTKDLTLDPTTHGAKNPPIARYAWWVEDESFKLNLNTAKAALRGKTSDEADVATAQVTARPSLQGLFAPGGGDAATVASAVESLRSSLKATGGRFLSVFQIGHVDASAVPSDTTAETFGRDYRFWLTTVSSGLNLSRTGAKRFNLNVVVQNSAPSAPTATSIRTAVSQIIAAIKVQAPHFGERFYRLSTTLGDPSKIKSLASTATTGKNALSVLPTAQSASTVPTVGVTLSGNHREIYLNKIAANIYDYISPNPNPTVIQLTTGNVLYGVVPTAYVPGATANGANAVFPENATANAGAVENPLAAVGKKAIPYFQEYVRHDKLMSIGAHQQKINSDPTTFSTQFTIESDHYFCFWNMTGRDINPAGGDLGKSPFLAVQDQPIYSCSTDDPKITSAGNYTIKSGTLTVPADGVLSERDFEIHLDDKFTDASGSQVNLVFKAGQFTVITTDPKFATYGVNLKIPGNVYAATALYYKTAPGAQVSAATRFDAGTDPGTNVRSFIVSTTRATSDNNNLFHVDIEGRNTALGGPADSQTKILLGNQNGFLDGHPAVSIERDDEGQPGNLDGSYPISLNWDDTGKSDPTLNFTRGSYIGGDSSNGGGDPRGNLEPLKWNYQYYERSVKNLPLGSATLPDGMGNRQGTDISPGRVKQTSNLGSWAGYNASSSSTYSQDPSGPGWWESDRSKKQADAADAPMVVAQAPMTSIGELGNIFDPIRFAANTASTGTLYFMYPGGKTLPVGQPDILWDGYGVGRTQAAPELSFQTSRSRTWTAWRLCDIFGTLEDEDPASAATYAATMRKPDAFTQAGLEIDGLYNPNGILRDQGRAFRALLEGITFSEDATLSGKTLPTAALDPNAGTGALLPLSKRNSYSLSDLGTGGQALANFLAIRLTRADASGTALNTFSPLWERGELSQLSTPYSSTATFPYLTDPGTGGANSGATAGTSTLLDGTTKTSAVSDRGREELFRRLAELVTMKGNTFSIYVVGQTMDRSGTVPVSTKARRILVRLHPAFTPALKDNFDPTSTSEITARFRSPDAWRIEVLGIEEGT